jgi:peptidoglycan/xylan/chitin deacetylase (PgdA/CDA1 family)
MTLAIDESFVPPEADAPASCPPPPAPQGRPRQIGVKQHALAASASILNACFGPRETEAFGILMYHRTVVPPPNQPKPTWNVSPEEFEAQLAGLLRRGWQAWSLRQVLHCRQHQLPIPRKTFVVTFDDGYANNLLYAAPILARLHVPATLFVATAYLDSKDPLPSDDWSAAGRPGVPKESFRPLTTEECLRLAGTGLVELGAHTHTHADFRGRPDALIADLEQNLAVLRDQFGVEQPPFALPYGTRLDGFASDELIHAAQETGVSCCLTADADLVRPNDSPFAWGRFAAEEHDSAASLAGKLGGWHTALRQLSTRITSRRTTAR